MQEIVRLLTFFWETTWLRPQKRIAQACLVIFLLGASADIATPVLSAESTKNNEPSLPAFSKQIYAQTGVNIPIACAIDQESGQVLLDHQGDQMHGIASLTKLLSLFVIYDAIASGHLSLETKIPISQALADQSHNPALSNVPLEARDDYYTVDDLLNASIIASANSAIVAIADYLAGSESAFVDLMKAKLASLGIHEYELYTASGLNRKWAMSDAENPPAENKMRPRDLLFLTQQLLLAYPDILERASMPNLPFKVNEDEEYLMRSTNEFLPGQAYQRNDVDGLKTGTETEAGYCILIHSKVANRPVLLLTMGAASNTQRFKETGALLDALQNNLQYTIVNQAGELFAASEQVDVYQGQEQKTALYYGEDAACFLPANVSQVLVNQVQFSKEMLYSPDGRIQVQAPLKRGEAVNRVQTYIPFVQNLAGEIMPIENTIVPEMDVGKVHASLRASRRMQNVLSNVKMRLGELYEEIWRQVDDGWRHFWRDLRQYFP